MSDLSVGLIDLHSHSNLSDGSLSPEGLVDHALECGIGTLALTDHDTTAGLQRFLSYARDKEIRALPGLEVSATWAKGNCHIVGIGVCDNYQPLEQILRKIRDGRDKRNERIVEKLNGLGCGITLGEVEELAGGDVVGRPHMARVMMSRGFVDSVQEAFDRYLAKGSPAYVDRRRLDPPDAVCLLREAGALVVLAHPSQLGLTMEKLDTFVGELNPHGLGAIEAYTPYSSDEEIAAYLDIAARHGLGVTGGSDFHGESKPDQKLGFFREGTPIPVERARACVERYLAGAAH